MTPPFSYISVIIPPWRGPGPSPKDNLYQVWLILEGCFWRRFWKIVCVFLLFRYYLPFKRGYPLRLKTLESSPSKDDLCQVWFKLAQWFWRKGSFLNDPIPFLHFCDYLPFEKDQALYLNKLEFHSRKDNLYQVWLNLDCWFWRRRFLKIFSVFLLFRYYLPLEKCYPLPLNKLESPSPKDDFCQVWLKLAKWFGEEVENVKVYRRTDRRTPCDQKSSLELSAQVS
jgi:hypothetical protein